MSKQLNFWLFFLLVNAIIFLLHYFIVGKTVYGDGRYYYAYTRSAIIDKDLNFKNEFEYFNIPFFLTDNHKIGNKFSIGPAILFAPFFLLAHLTSYTLKILGWKIVLDGYNGIYQILVGLGGVVYAYFGLMMCFFILKQYFSSIISKLAILTIFFGTNLLFYGAIDTVNSHAVSFFISSLLMFLISKFWQKLSTRLFLYLGLVLAFLAMIRLQDLIFIIPVLLFIINKAKSKTTSTIVFIASLVVFFMPQILVWLYLYGRPISPYFLLGEKFNFFSPKISSVLFSNNNGLFTYSPILIFSFTGLILFNNKNKFLSLTGILLFAIQLYIVASWHDWWGGAAYGQRMFIVLMPFFIIGLANLIDRFKCKMKVVSLICSLFVIWNCYSIFKFLLAS